MSPVTWIARGSRRVGLSIAVAVSLAGGYFAGQALSPRADASAGGSAPFGFSDVVFLSHVNTEDMPIFPGDPHVVIDPIFTVSKDGFRLQLMRIGEHTGTHWGSPCHFTQGARCADDLAAEDFFHPAVVIDVRDETEADVDFRLRVADLEAFEAAHGTIPDNAMVIMWTGFQGRWDDPEAYVNEGADGLLHFPGFSVQATRWLIENRNLGGLGIDTLGVDPGTDEHFRTNTLLLHEHRIHIENMANLGSMPTVGGWVIVGGVVNEQGSGSPATVFGLVP